MQPVGATHYRCLFWAVALAMCSSCGIAGHEEQISQQRPSSEALLVNDARHRELLTAHKAFLLAACPSSRAGGGGGSDDNNRCRDLAAAIARCGKIALRLAVSGQVRG